MLRDGGNNGTPVSPLGGRRLSSKRAEEYTSLMCLRVPERSIALARGREASMTDITVNGYDAYQVWGLCKAKGLSALENQNVIVQEFDPNDVRAAFDGNGVQVLVRWSSPELGSMLWAAAYNGDAANPTLRAFDTPHAGK